MGANDAKMQLSPSIFFYETRDFLLELLGCKKIRSREWSLEEDIQFDNDTSVSD